ncbi:MAG: hypothetical protein WCF84_23285 [Anaerolineae bacterium]
MLIDLWPAIIVLALAIGIAWGAWMFLLDSHFDACAVYVLLFFLVPFIGLYYGLRTSWLSRLCYFIALCGAISLLLGATSGSAP